MLMQLEALQEGKPQEAAQPVSSAGSVQRVRRGTQSVAQLDVPFLQIVSLGCAPRMDQRRMGLQDMPHQRNSKGLNAELLSLSN